MRHIATFSMPGEYGTLLLSTRRETAVELTAHLDELDLWGVPFVQIDDSAVAYCYSGDPVSVAVSIYRAPMAEPLPRADAEHVGKFISKGERVFLGSIMSLGFEDHCESFYLPPGDYDLRCLGANLDRGCDGAYASIEELLTYQRHVLVFRS
jgi:hypothetical protein